MEFLQFREINKKNANRVPFGIDYLYMRNKLIY